MADSATVSIVSRYNNRLPSERRRATVRRLSKALFSSFKPQSNAQVRHDILHLWLLQHQLPNCRAGRNVSCCSLSVSVCMKNEFGVCWDASAVLDAVKQKHLNECCATEVTPCGFYGGRTRFPSIKHFYRQVAAHYEIMNIVVWRLHTHTHTHRHAYTHAHLAYWYMQVMSITRSLVHCKLQLINLMKKELRFEESLSKSLGWCKDVAQREFHR